MRIPLARPTLAAEDERLVLEALRSRRLTSGAMTVAFEESVAGYLGARHAVAVSSGTAALHLALLAAGVGPADEVLVPDFTFPATAHAVRHCGATPGLVDVDPERLTMTRDTLERFERRSLRREGDSVVDQSTGLSVRAIVPVHLFGLAAPMDEVMAFAARLGLVVVEDAAPALGAVSGGQRCGTFGVAGCISFHPRKIVTTGEGGIVVTDDERLACRVRELRTHGQHHRDGGTVFVEAGYNYRLDEASAALGVAQMRRVDDIIHRLAELAWIYDTALAETGLGLPPRDPGRVYQAYVVMLPEGVDRDALIDALAADGIEAAPGTYAVSGQPAYAGLPGGEVAALAQRRSLAVPLYAEMTREDAELVAERLRVLLARPPRATSSNTRLPL